MNIVRITAAHRNEVNKILKNQWDCPPSVSKGKIIDTTVLPGFVSISDTGINGVVTYHIESSACEIVTLNSFEENRGIGTALINAVQAAARSNNCNRIWLITTNDDIGAICFYQKRGFEWVATHINTMDLSRKLKPSIPLVGMHGIPIKHEIEFEIRLS